MAETTPTTYVPGADEENKLYQQAYKNMIDSLDARKNQLFDPVLLAMAQGFGAPTKSGSIFESLGTAAGTVGAAQQQQLAQDQALAAAKFDIAGKGLEMARQRRADEEFQKLAQRYAGGEPPAAPPAAPVGPLSKGEVSTDVAQPNAPSIPVKPLTPLGEPPIPVGGAETPPTTAPVAAPTGGLPVADKPKGYENVEGIPIAPPNPAIATGLDILNMGRFDKNKSRADLLKEAQEAETRRYRDRENGVMDLRTGMYYPSPAGAMVEKQIYGQTEKTYKVNPNTSALLDHYAATNDPRYWDIANRVINGPTPPAPKVDTSAGVTPNVSTGVTPSITPVAKPTGLASQQDIEAAAAAKKEAATIEAKSQAQQAADFRTEIIQNAKTAPTEITLAKEFKSFVDDPKFGKMIGILNNPGIVAAVGLAVEHGVGVGEFRLGLPNLQEIIRTYAADNQLDLAKLNRFVQLGTQMQLAGNKMFGNRVTNYEERILGKTIISPEENAATARMKADAMIARAEFNTNVNNAFRQLKMNATEFFTNPDSPYAKMVEDYTKILEAIDQGKTLIPKSPASPKTPKVGKGKDLDAARDKVNKILRD
jgi:hypothetical protein